MRLSTGFRSHHSGFLKFGKLFILIALCSFSAELSAHSTAVAQCRVGNQVRVYVEHYHNNATNFTMASVSITTIVDGVSMTDPAVPVAGYFNDTPMNSLPCSNTISLVNVTDGSGPYGSCARPLTFNDWAYFDFPLGECYSTLEIIINDINDPSNILQPCNGLYPAVVDEMEIVDETPPEVNCDIIMNVTDLMCMDALPPAFDISDFTITDDCTDGSEVDLIVSDIILNEAGCPIGLPTVERTYSFLDDFGRITQCSQLIDFIDDVEPPKLVCPGPLTVECDDPELEANVEAWLQSPLFGDNCGEATLSDDYASSPLLGSRTITFTAEDGCGNISSCTALLTIRDRTNPIVTCPSDITVECGDPNNDALITNWLENAAASDECDDVTLSNNFTALSVQECGGVSNVTFVALDGSGNRAVCRSTITHNDSSAPELLMKPQDISVDCINSSGGLPEINAWLAAFGNGMALDACDPTIILRNELVEEVPLCGYTYRREYLFTATDDCGNESTATAFATVVDETPPVINFIWDELIQACTDNNEANLASYLEQNKRATDVCMPNADINVEWILLNDVSSCGGTIDRSYLYTATDDCGNSSTAVFHYMTTDNVIPTWSGPPGHLYPECGDPNNPTIVQAWIDEVEQSTLDACGGELIVTNDWDGVFPEDCVTTLPIVFTVVDDCGNIRNTLQRNIYQRDRVNPIILNCPNDMTVNVDVDNCSSNVIFSTPIGYDQCSPVVTVDQIRGPASGSEFPLGTTRITFEAIDDCGRRSNPDCDFNITVVDSDTPSLDCPSTIDVCTQPGLCHWSADDSVFPTSGDSCSGLTGTITITGATTFSSGPVMNPTDALQDYQLGTSELCYSVSDASGNSSSCCVDINVTDCEGPMVTCPVDLTVICEDSQLATWLNSATASDNCSSSFSFTNIPFNTISGCGNANETVYQFTATDESGNETMCLASYIIEDNTAPEISTPASDGSSDCHNATNDLLVWLNDNGNASATDGCGEVTWSHDFLGGVLTGCSGLTSRNDSIRNGGLIDNSNWTVGSGSDTGGDTDFYAIGSPGEDNRIMAEDPFGKMTVVWEAGNDVASNADGGWNTNQFPIDNTKLYRFSTWVNRKVLGANGRAYLGVYGYGSTNGVCNPSNGATVTNPYFFYSASPPTMLPECEWVLVVGHVFPHTYTGTADHPDSGLYTVANNNIGSTISDYKWLPQTTSALHRNYLFYSTDPAVRQQFVYPRVDCVDGTEPSIDELLAGYDCKVDLDDNTFSSVTVTFTATDECGNTSTSQASFSVEDSEAPELTCPEQLDLECGNTLNDPVIDLWLSSIQASDNCSEVTLTNDYDANFTAGCGGTGTYTVEFTATDDCDNLSTCVANIVISDTTVPQFLMKPQDLIVECGPGAVDPATWIAENGGAMAADQCDADLTWTVTPGAATSGCGDSESIEYTFTVEDDCGNSASATSRYVFEDTSDPTVIPPTDITVECAAALNSLADWQAGASASDDCGDGFTFEAILFNTISGCGNSDVEVYQFTATDACGNQGTALASYTIEDTTIPTITCPPDLNIECGDQNNDLMIIAWLNSATGSDACGEVTFAQDFDGTLPDNCGGTVLVTFEVSDACGNEVTCNSNLIMDDTNPPDFTNCPLDMTINVDVDVCGSNPIFSTPSVVDNCGVTVTQTGGIASGGTFPVGTTAIEFTATDECGNTSLCNYNLTVVDSDEPLILCPETQSYVCVDEGTCQWTGENLEPTLGQENCPGYDITYMVNMGTGGSGADDASGTLFDLGMNHLCYTVTDASGNTSMCCSHVYVIDCETPELTCPDFLKLECDGDGNKDELAAWLNTATAVDNCDDDPDITYQEYNIIKGCGSRQVRVYEFTATDNAGNISVCISEFKIIDKTPPTLDAPAENMSVECTSGASNSNVLLAWLNDNGGALASDICADVSWSNDYTEPLTDFCAGTSTVTFTATDECGNFITTSADFTIMDVTDPQITCPLPVTLECNDAVNEAVITNWLSTVTATDECSEVNITSTYPNVFTPGCGDTGTYTVEFMVTDDCDNSSTCTSIVTIEDESDPVFDLNPQDLVLECADGNNAAFIAAWIAANGNAVASDQCSDVTWVASALDPSEGCGATENTPYVFTVTDACGNTSTRMASVIVENTTAPIVTPPADITVECDGSGNGSELLAWLTTASGASDCGDVNVVSGLYNSISACGGASSETYIFTATDDCGNESTGLASFTIEDTMVPDPTCPPSLELECGEAGNDQAIIAWLQAMDVVDDSACSETSFTHNYNGQLPGLLCDGNPGNIVTFTATDACGNSAECQSTITMDDTLVPDFANCPTDLTVNVDTDLCSSNVVYSQPVATDICDQQVNVVLTSGIPSGTAFPLGMTSILFTATDACGNTNTCTFDITVEDSDIPEIECPSNAFVVCADDGTCEWSSSDEINAIFVENCPAAGYTVTYVVTGATSASSAATGQNQVGDDGVIFNLGVSEVCYTISDDAGNSAQCCFDVIVEDCEKPAVSCPDNMTVECNGAGNLAELTAWLGSMNAMDNCDGVIILDNQVFNSVSGCGGTESFIYEFTATDSQGNVNSCFAEFSIIDSTQPELSVTANDLVVECAGTGNSDALTAWLNASGGAEASDLCGEITWTHDFLAPLSGSCEGSSTTMVTFTASDDCGNESMTTANFTIEDTTEPVLSCPENITLECSDDINAAIVGNWLQSANASDACSEVVMENNYGDIFVEDCGMTGVHMVTFIATDDCGNTSSCDRMITIVDTTDPEIVIEAQDLILECADPDAATLIAAWEASFGGALASDGCSDAALTWAILSETEITNCGSTTSTLYTFEVTDNCGNTSTTAASVIYEDTTPPQIVVPQDQTEECANILVSVTDWIAEATATDECGGVTITAVLWNSISGCGGTDSETYLFTATDECGNETTGFAEYIIEDTSDPTVVCPDDLPLTCGNESNDLLIINWLNSASATDAFGCSQVQITNDFPAELPILDCNGGMGIDIVFTAVDDCDNSNSCTATITMDDAEEPYFSNCPLNMTVNVDVDLCETNVVYSQPIALDDCDENVDVSLTSGLASGTAFPIGTTTILFTATDDCGNTSTCEFDITVVDSDIPSIDCPSNDVYVCTDEGGCDWEATDVSSAVFMENCADEGYVVTYEITGETTASSPLTGINDVDDDDVVFNLGVSEVCYTISDDAGNSAQCCFDVIVEDCEAPSLTCNNEESIACGEEDIAGWFDGIAATAMDNCPGELNVDTLLITDFSSCGTTFERVYLFTVTDAAGNESTCLATYETDDTEEPVITDAEDLIIECTDGSQSTTLLAWLNNNGGASFSSDNCSSGVSWTNDFNADLEGTCGANGSVTIIFTATDDCGNTSTTSANFIIEDETPPVLTCPTDITLECDGSLNEVVIINWLDNASSEDACQGTLELVNNYEEVFEPDCGLTGVHTVTFSTMDACDNASSCDATITIIDLTPPIIDVQPVDLVLECAGTINSTQITDWVENFGGAMATDECSDEDLSWIVFETLATGGCGDTGSTLYTFQVTDNCGNTATTQASVIIEDTTPPVLNVPEDQVEECNNISLSVQDWLAEVSGSDDCGAVTFTSELWNTISDCGGTYRETYRFVASDACGNETVDFADYEIDDTSNPIITCPDPIMLTCGNESNDLSLINWLNSAFASDVNDCSSVSISNDFPDGLPELACNGGAGTIINFTATDDCGNSSSCTGLITIDDQVEPYFSNCPIDMTVNVDVDLCESNVVYSQPIALDNCDEDVDVALIEGIPSGMPFPLGTTTLTFEAVDACGNTSTCSFDITVVDSGLPSIHCPSNDVVVCTDPATCTWVSTDQTDPVFNDNCPGQSMTFAMTGATTANSADTGVNTIANDAVVFNLGETEIVYTITDPSGNEASCSFDVVVEDCEDPTITCSDAIDVTCGDENLSTWFDGIASTVTDNCDVIPSLEVDTLLLTDFSSCGNTFDRVYMFTVTDVAGNNSTCIARYESDDLVPPTNK